MFYLIDWNTRTFGDGHKKLEDAVKQYESHIEHLMKTKDEFHISVVEFTFTKGDNGVPQYTALRHFIKVPK